MDIHWKTITEAIYLEKLQVLLLVYELVQNFYLRMWNIREISGIKGESI